MPTGFNYHRPKDELFVTFLNYLGMRKETRVWDGTVDTEGPRLRPLPALVSPGYLLWPMFVLPAGRQDVLKWCGQASHDYSPNARSQLGWLSESMSMCEGCLRPDRRQKAADRSCHFQPGLVWGRAQKRVQSAPGGEVTSGYPLP